ncbi:hypothetical protein ACQKJC_13075 [Priestia koreensis]|uniref:hypothetical protein n=1 Tax=Priestia koreensis TaxID=284581 RepID=UPI003D055DAB
MKKLYLSNLQTKIPSSSITVKEYIDYFSNWKEDDDPFYWLIKDSNIPFHSNIKTDFIWALDEPIPALQNSISDMLITWLNDCHISEDNINFLMYCHETVEHHSSLTTAFKVKQKLKLKKCLPFSIGHSGSLAVASGIEVAASLVAEEEGELLFIIADSYDPPLKRLSNDAFIKGDAFTSMTVNHSDGEYELVSFGRYSALRPPTDSNLSCTNYLKQEELLLEQSYRVIKDVIKAHSINNVIAQNLSTHYIESINDFCLKNKMKFTKRMEWGNINFLGSDPFITLNHAYKSTERTEDGTFLLLWGSIHHGVGYMVIKTVNKT